MSHVNKIYDSDPHFTISPITRQIKNDSSQKTTLIQGDHNSERFSFSLARFVEGHDMTECNRIEVHYKNGGFVDVYEVKDMQTSPEDEETIVFSWLLSKNATRNEGKLEFAIRLACVSDDGSEEYSWNTAIYNGITVSKGMNNSEAVVEENSDTLAQWKNELFGTSEEGVENINTAKAESLEAIEALGNEMYDRLYFAPISTVPVTLEANKEYSFGEVSELSLAFPTIANNGDVVYLTFKSGSTATSLTIDTTNTSDIEIIPEANCYYDIFAKFNGFVWLVNYSEYLVSEV